MTMWLRKYLDKLGQGQNFSFLKPSLNASWKRPNSMLRDIKWQEFTRNGQNNRAIQYGNIIWESIASPRLILGKIYVTSHPLSFNFVSFGMQLEKVSENENFFLVITCPIIFWVTWSSIPTFYTCKKTWSSVLSAHQIWAWYLKPCQKKVGCQNYCGLPITLYVVDVILVIN